MAQFSEYVTEHAKTNRNLRLDVNYDSIEVARKRKTEELWLQDKNAGSELESASISLDQAKWLVEQLQYFINLLEGDVTND
jgi:hypothetical protein